MFVPRPTTRRGYTLIELLIVISIILFLMTAVTMVIGNVLTNAREAATKATIIKINGLLQQRVEAFQRADDRADKATKEKQVAAVRVFLMGDPVSGAPGAFTSNPNGMPRQFNKASDRMWAVLRRKLFFLINFPVTFREIGGFDDTSATPPRATGVPGTMIDDDSDGVVNFYPNGAPDPDEFGVGTGHSDTLAFGDILKKKLTNPASHNPATESSELMYILLTQARLFGVPPVDENEFTTAEVKDTDGDGLMEFVDAWEQPLRFYRWPTMLIRCGEDLDDDGTLDSGEDLDGDSTLDNPGAGSLANPMYASLLDTSLPSLKRKDPVLMRDPDDGFGLIASQLIKAGVPRPTNAEQTARRLRFEQVFHSPETFHAFLIVSAGPDKDLGIYEPSDRANYGHLARLIKHGDLGATPLNDNITNRKK